MDTLRSTARRLGTTTPRVSRAVRSLGIEPPPGRAFGLTEDQVEAVRRRLGCVPVIDGLSRQEVMVLAALDRRPLGVRSARAIARDTGLSPTTAGKVLAHLCATGWCNLEVLRLTEGVVVDAPVVSLDRDPRWSSVSSTVRQTTFPERRPPRGSPRVPRRLWHHFWNAPAAHLSLPEDAEYVAGRLLLSHDPQAIAWAYANVDRATIGRVAGKRGLEQRTRGWLRNLAEAG